jgi:hypothetical protein
MNRAISNARTDAVQSKVEEAGEARTFHPLTPGKRGGEKDSGKPANRRSRDRLLAVFSVLFPEYRYASFVFQRY